MMFLLALLACCFGQAEMFSGKGRFVSSIKYKGELDVYFLQPRPLIPNLLCLRMNIAGWGDILYEAVLFLFNQPFTIGSILLFLRFSLMAAPFAHSRSIAGLDSPGAVFPF